MDKVICIGKNYLEHAKEMGDGIPDKPIIFFKPPSAVVQTSHNGTIEAEAIQNQGALHHECEIVLRVGPDGKTFDAVTLGLDMTLRDLQSDLKKKGQPWEKAKAFRQSALIGPWMPIAEFPDFLNKQFMLLINGAPRQIGVGRDMRTSPHECLKYCEQFFTILPGDLLFSGTPEGVGPILAGDIAELQWENLNFKVHWV